MHFLALLLSLAAAFPINSPAPALDIMMKPTKTHEIVLTMTMTGTPASTWDPHNTAIRTEVRSFQAYDYEGFPPTTLRKRALEFPKMAVPQAWLDNQPGDHDAAMSTSLVEVTCCNLVDKQEMSV